MKKTLIAIASFSAVLSAQAGELGTGKGVGVTSSSEIIDNGRALLVDKRTRIKLYPEVNPPVTQSQPTGINIIETKTVQVNTQVNTIEIVHPSQQNIAPPPAPLMPVEVVQPPAQLELKTGEVIIGDARPGYKPEVSEKVYTKSFLGIGYAPVYVVKPAEPIYFGELHYNNLTCKEGLNNGTIKLFSNMTNSIIPVKFCPMGKEAQVELNIETNDNDMDRLLINIGGQKVPVEKGFTSLYQLRYDDVNAIDLEFIFEKDEHPIRY